MTDEVSVRGRERESSRPRRFNKEIRAEVVAWAAISYAASSRARERSRIWDELMSKPGRSSSQIQTSEKSGDMRMSMGWRVCMCVVLNAIDFHKPTLMRRHWRAALCGSTRHIRPRPWASVRIWTRALQIDHHEVSKRSNKPTSWPAPPLAHALLHH